MISVKIKKITKLEKKEDVYDIIGVPNNHNFLANHIVVHNCDLFGRGLGAIFVKDLNPVNDSWRMANFKDIGSYTEFTPLNKIQEQLKMHPNFWKIIKVPKPPEWLYTRYLQVREKNIYDDEDVLGLISKDDIYKAILVLCLRDMMANDNTITVNRLLIHVKNQFDLSLQKNTMLQVIEDCKQLIRKIQTSGININDDKLKLLNEEEVIGNVEEDGTDNI